MQRALDNLINNAVKYSPRQSVIMIMMSPDFYRIENGEDKVIVKIHFKG